MDQLLDTLNLWLADNPGWITFAIAGTALLESLAIAGLAVPGVAMLFVIAAAAGHQDLSAWGIMGWAFVGAVVGDGISFWLGQHFQDRIRTFWPFSRHPRALVQGEDFFHRHGGKSVILGRFVGPVRPIIPMVAGALGMSRYRFLAFNLLSALGWAPLYILPGYLVGASMTVESDLPAHFYPVLLLSVFVAALALAFFFRIHLGLLPEGALYGAAERFVQRHALTQRIWERLTRPRGDFQEFPLASLVLAITATFGFCAWTLTVIHTPWLDSFNHLTMVFFLDARSDWSDPLFLALTLSGDSLLLAAGFALFTAVLFAKGHRPAAVHLLAGGLATLLLTAGLKYGLYLARPETVDLPPVTPAYPSGHSSGATVLYGLIAAFAAQELHRSKRWQIYAAAAIPILLVALSRLYLGVHWFTDTVGGVLLGLAICGVIRSSFSGHDRQKLHLDLHLALTFVIWAALVVLYVIWRWQEAILNYAPTGI